LTLLHASAVGIGGEIVALTGPSGTGKSSVALHLVAQGGRFFADDVVALTRAGERLVGHPGAQFANLHPHEAEAVPPEDRGRLGRQMGASDRLHVEPDGLRDPRPLRALYMLHRRAHEGAPWVAPVEPDPIQLLGNGFLPQLQSPEHLTTELDLWSTMARAQRVFSVEIPLDSTAPQVAAAVMRHAEELA
jgi:hypothetical protein